MDAITSGGSYSYAGFAYSMAGTAIFPVGVETGRSIMNADVSVLNDYDQYAPIISNLTSKYHGNVFAEAYAVKFLDAIETTEEEKSVRFGRIIYFICHRNLSRRFFQSCRVCYLHARWTRI